MLCGGLGWGGIFCYGLFVWVVIELCLGCIWKSGGYGECYGVFFDD